MVYVCVRRFDRRSWLWLSLEVTVTRSLGRSSPVSVTAAPSSAAGTERSVCCFCWWWCLCFCCCCFPINAFCPQAGTPRSLSAEDLARGTHSFSWLRLFCHDKTAVCCTRQTNAQLRTLPSLLQPFVPCRPSCRISLFRLCCPHDGGVRFH